MPDEPFDPGPEREPIVADEVDPDDVDAVLAHLLIEGASDE